MRSISSIRVDKSRLGHVIEDIQRLVHGLSWGCVSCVKRGANAISHSLAHFLKKSVSIFVRMKS